MYIKTSNYFVHIYTCWKTELNSVFYFSPSVKLNMTVISLHSILVNFTYRNTTLCIWCIFLTQYVEVPCIHIRCSKTWIVSWLFWRGSSWLWSHGSLIYNYLCNQCPSPLKLWARTPFMAKCTGYNIIWQSL